MALSLTLIIFSLILSGIISGTETALVSVNKFRIRRLAGEGHHRAKMVMQLTTEHEKFFGAILLANNVVNILLASVATSLAINLWGNTGGVVAMSTVVTTALLVIFGELTPKSIAAIASERWSFFIARPFHILTVMTTPLVYVFTLLPKGIVHLMGGRQALDTPTVTEGELRMLIDMGEEEGTVGSRRGAMLEGVFRLTELDVRDVMTPRNEIVWVESGTRISDFLEYYRETQHTRFPVYEDDPDDVVGVISIKDVLRNIAENPSDLDQPVTRIMRNAMFVPETNKLNVLFRQFQQSGHKVALVVDEFGGIAGLVTLTRLLEQIVGRTGEEGGQAEERIVTLDENSYELDGGLSIDEANERLNLELPEGEYNTVAGFILEHLQRMPNQGERVRYENLRFLIAKVEGNKIMKVRVRRRRPVQASASA